MSARSKSIAVVAGMVLPFVALVLVVFWMAVDVPLGDEWEMVLLLRKHADHTLTLADFWTLHNEHRIPLLRAILLGLVLATHWSVPAELAVQLGFAAVYFALIALAARRLSGTSWLLPLVSLMVFSLNQFENWLWGWQIQIFLNLASVVGGLLLLVGELTWPRFAGAILLGQLAQYSFANGLLFWPLGLVALVACHGRRRGLIVLWVVVSALSVACYLRGYSTPVHHRAALLEPGNLGRYLGYVLAYLGTPLSRSAAAPVGAAGLVALVGLSVHVWRRGLARLSQLGALLLPAAYAVGSALMTGIGRVGFGAEQAQSSRYVSFATLLWIANLSLVALVVERARERGERRTARFGLGAVGLMAALALFSTGDGFGVIRAITPEREAARADLAAFRDEHLTLLYPSLERLRQDRVFLREQHLSVFRR